MAKGEKRWSPSGPAVRMTFDPVPPKDWDAKIDASAVEIAKGAQDKGGIPYIKGLRLTCLGSAMKEGGKDRKIFLNYLALSLKPTANGNPMTAFANQLTGLMYALGDIRDFPTKVMVINEEGEEVEYLDPKEVKDYLKSHDGEVIKIHSKTQNSDTHGKQAVVDYFIEAELSDGGSDDDEGDVDEEPEETEEDEAEEPEEADEADEEADDEPEEEEEKPAPKKKAPPAKKKGKK